MNTRILDCLAAALLAAPAVPAPEPVPGSLRF
jgi:hypothetical protein